MVSLYGLEGLGFRTNRALNHDANDPTCRFMGRVG